MFRALFATRRPAPARRSFRPRLECLEGRDTPSTTVLTVSPNPATAGQSVTLTATVTSGSGELDPYFEGDTVTFYDNNTPLTTVQVTAKDAIQNPSQGIASFTTSGLAAGTHDLYAHFSGLTNGTLFFNAPSDSNYVSEVVNAAPTPPQAAAPVPLAAASAAGGSVVVLPVPVAPHHHANPLVQHFMAVNMTGSPVEGPLFVVLRGLNHNVHVKGRAGMTLSGSPFVLLSEAGLAPGQEVSLTLSFSNPNGAHIHFTPQVVDFTGLL